MGELSTYSSEHLSRSAHPKAAQPRVPALGDSRGVPASPAPSGILQGRGRMLSGASETEESGWYSENPKHSKSIIVLNT